MGWRKDESKARLRKFMSLLKASNDCNVASIVVKNIDNFPIDKKNPQVGTIDMYTIVHDGGLILLLGHLLTASKVYSHCKLRYFVVVPNDVDLERLRSKISKYIYDVRIKAEVKVIQLDMKDLSAYSVQMTMGHDQRRQFFLDMNMTAGDLKKDLQCIIDEANRERKDIRKDDELMGNNNNNSNSNAIKAHKKAITHNHNVKKREVEDNPLLLLKSDVDTDLELTLPTVAIKDATPPASESPTLANANQGFIETPTSILPTPELVGSTSSCNSTGLTTSGKKKEVRICMTSIDHGGSGEDTSGSTRLSSSDFQRANEFTFNVNSNLLMNSSTENVRKLHTAYALNEMICERSKDAALVIINLPSPSKNSFDDLNSDSLDASYNYLEYIERLVDSIPHVLLIRGTGKEVITIFAE